MVRQSGLRTAKQPDRPTHRGSHAPRKRWREELGREVVGGRDWWRGKIWLSYSHFLHSLLHLRFRLRLPRSYLFASPLCASAPSFT
eukprot:6191151-Pleurochrysis_carterae.AAC.2